MKKVFVIFLSVFLLVGCKAYFQSPDISSLDVGMTKEKVFSYLKEYRVRPVLMSMVVLPDGAKEEVYSYYEVKHRNEFVFIDGIYVEFHRVYLPPIPSQEPVEVTVKSEKK